MVMNDYDVVIIGSGPAGLSAGIYLTRGKYNTLVIENENLGGQITKVEWIENYPGFSKGIAGPQLASEMLAQATNFGLQIDLGEVSGIELYSKLRCIQLTDGRTITTKAIVVASGCHRMKLGVPGEINLENKGVFSCALCDGDQFTGKKVAICGGGDSGLTEAIYMTKLASSVVLIEATQSLTASPILQERASNIQKLKILCNTKINSIIGSSQVEAIELEYGPTKLKEVVKVDGVLVDIGMKPNTKFLRNTVPIDGRGYIIVNEKMEAAVPYIYAAGDVRCGSLGQVVTGVNDGAVAAISIQKLLQKEL
jgi:thioredoxin reductase (NADPH)